MEDSLKNVIGRVGYGESSSSVEGSLARKSDNSDLLGDVDEIPVVRQTNNNNSRPYIHPNDVRLPLKPGEEFLPFVIAREAMKNGDHRPEEYEEEGSLEQSVGIIGCNLFQQLDLALLKTYFVAARTPELMGKIGKAERNMDYSGAGDAGRQLGIVAIAGAVGGVALVYGLKYLEGRL